jgi:hypothetical protein
LGAKPVDEEQGASSVHESIRIQQNSAQSQFKNSDYQASDNASGNRNQRIIELNNKDLRHLRSKQHVASQFKLHPSLQSNEQDKKDSESSYSHIQNSCTGRVRQAQDLLTVENSVDLVNHKDSAVNQPLMATPLLDKKKQYESIANTPAVLQMQLEKANPLLNETMKHEKFGMYLKPGDNYSKASAYGHQLQQSTNTGVDANTGAQSPIGRTPRDLQPCQVYATIRQEQTADRDSSHGSSPFESRQFMSNRRFGQKRLDQQSNQGSLERSGMNFNSSIYSNNSKLSIGRIQQTDNKAYQFTNKGDSSSLSMNNN